MNALNLDSNFRRRGLDEPHRLRNSYAKPLTVMAAGLGKRMGTPFHVFTALATPIANLQLWGFWRQCSPNVRRPCGGTKSMANL